MTNFLAIPIVNPNSMMIDREISHYLTRDATTTRVIH